MDELDRVDLVLKGTSAFGFLLLVLAIVGELLGWWNDLGEAMAIVGTVVGVFSLLLALLWGASRRQVAGAATQLHVLALKADEQRSVLQEHGGLLRENTGLLRQTTGLLQQQSALLTQIRDRL